jgi:hypothetical protein
MLNPTKVEVEVACIDLWLPTSEMIKSASRLTWPAGALVLEALLKALPALCTEVLNRTDIYRAVLRPIHVRVVPTAVHTWAENTPTLVIKMKVRNDKPDPQRDTFILAQLAQLLNYFFETQSTKPTIQITLLPLEGTQLYLETSTSTTHPQ